LVKSWARHKGLRVGGQVQQQACLPLLICDLCFEACDRLLKIPLTAAPEPRLLQLFDLAG